MIVTFFLRFSRTEEIYILHTKIKYENSALLVNVKRPRLYRLNRIHIFNTIQNMNNVTKTAYFTRYTFLSNDRLNAESVATSFKLVLINNNSIQNANFQSINFFDFCRKLGLIELKKHFYNTLILLQQSSSPNLLGVIEMVVKQPHQLTLLYHVYYANSSMKCWLSLFEKEWVLNRGIDYCQLCTFTSHIDCSSMKESNSCSG